ncbi:MAG: 5-deoxy-glucuronate isomerase [Acidimicrobiales bacterium]
MTNTKLHQPAGSLSDGSDPIHLTPEQAGWNYSGLRVLKLEAGVTRIVQTGEFEMAILPLSGAGMTVDCEGEHFELEGRETVFSRVTDFAYVPRDSEFEIASADGAEVALCMAKARVKLSPKYGPAENVEVETRGGGPATRQVTNFLTPSVWGHADRLMCCELLTPDGNWSSYPPHKHDDSPECEVNNEEIYYFRIGTAGTTEYSVDGFGMHRTYTGPNDAAEIDENVVVADGDAFLVPRGYHGPCIAAPGYTMYYLNILAGPSGERSMAFCDDPTHHWVRDTWEGMPQDQRSPMTNARGVIAK